MGIDAFDLRQHEIDITPWLPLLCDGASHTFEIRVAGLNDDGAGHATLSEVVGSYWVVTGTVFLFLGKEGVTKGTLPSIDTALPEIQISSSITTDPANKTLNETLVYTTAVTRNISISSTIETSSGTRTASWNQILFYSNFNSLTDQGFEQVTSQNTTGSDHSASGYANTYSYPIYVETSFASKSLRKYSVLGEELKNYQWALPVKLASTER